MKRFVIAVLVALLFSTSSCVFHRVQTSSVDPRGVVAVGSPVKAHLKDGATVIYANGVTVSGGMLRGSGVRYDLALKQSGTVDMVPIDEVLGMETFETKVAVGKTILATSLGTAGGIVAGAVLAVAIFGSCPTVYSGDGVEEAELFSTSIAPLFEARDTDRLRAQPGSNGVLRLEVRNEAMETHYINHLQILEATHDPSEVVLPDIQGLPIAVRNVHAVGSAAARNGQDVADALSKADGVAYRTDRAALERATAADLEDWIDLTAPVPAGTTAATLVFRLRNSLLSTDMLYNTMLAPAGARALDWLGADLARISTAVELGRWYGRRANLRVQVWRDGAFQESAVVYDSGPISWHDSAATIPVPPGETSLRVRLSFLADYWRVDRVGISAEARPIVPRAIDIDRITGSEGRADDDAMKSLRAPDDRHLQTNPGQRFFADFNVGPTPAGMARTFLLSSQGYYTEWIRGDWIKNGTAKQSFAPGDDALVLALRQWAVSRDPFEERFMKARVPVQ